MQENTWLKCICMECIYGIAYFPAYFTLVTFQLYSGGSGNYCL